MLWWWAGKSVGQKFDNIIELGENVLMVVMVLVLVGIWGGTLLLVGLVVDLMLVGVGGGIGPILLVLVG